jgi:7-cyano-7-deazaguanine synthase
MSDHAVVVLSGGQDSTTCLYWALARYAKVTAVTFDYGQRHSPEIQAAVSIATRADVDHHILSLKGVLGSLGDSALVGTKGDIQGSGGIPDYAMPQGLPTSFVPGRNLLMLSAAASLAVKVGARHLVTGVCQTDYSGYPDCRREFIDALETALDKAMPSSAGPFTIQTPLMEMTKGQTVQLAADLPGCWDALALTVTCYHGKRPGCGTCPACDLRIKGFAAAGKSDPSRPAQESTR